MPAETVTSVVPLTGGSKLTPEQRERLKQEVAQAQAARLQDPPAVAPKPKAKAAAKPKATKAAAAKVAGAPKKPSPEYSVLIECIQKVNGKKCGAKRWIKPQDAFQVHRCVPCTKVYKNERAKARRAAKAKAKVKA
jgi:hypothetical protein